MTVTSDLATALGSQRRLFARIEAIEEELWQDDGTGAAPSGRTRTGYCCLLPPQEMAQEFDLSEMKTGLSAMTFEVLDIKDSDGTSHFGKLWGAPSRWDSVDHYRVAEGTGFHQYVYATDTSIPVEYAPNTSTPGTLYMHGERIAYTSITGTDTIAGCTRGMYPPLGDNLGKTALRPQETDGDIRPALGQVPFMFVGSRICLFVTTRDPSTGTWHGESDDVLLWTGRIGHSIVFVPTRNVWQLTAESIIQELDKPVCNRLSKLTLDGGAWKDGIINLTGGQGRGFAIQAWDDAGVDQGRRYCEVEAHVYNRDQLCKAVMAAWLTGTGAALTNTITLGCRELSDGTCEIELRATAYRSILLVGGTPGQGGGQHVLRALGFSTSGPIEAELADIGSGVYQAVINSGDAMFAWYQPLDVRCNNGYLYTSHEQTGRFLEQEANEGSYIRLPKAIYSDNYGNEDEGDFYVNVTAEQLEAHTIVPEVTYYNRITLGAYLPYRPEETGYVGFRVTDDPTILQQVMMISNGGQCGPFESLLPLILSTGDNNANGTYDTLPYGWGLGIPKVFVNTQSFVDADEYLEPDVAKRNCYPVDKATPLSELIRREAMLFHKSVALRNGELRVVDLANLEGNAWTVELSESNRYLRRDIPDYTQSADTVVNQWTLQLHDIKHGEELPLITVTDADSMDSLGETKQVEIDHPGIFVEGGITPETIGAWMKTSRPSHFRRPLPVLEVSLMPSLAMRVFVGDVVKFSSTCTPDPTGGGTNNTTCYALVTKVGWDYSIWKGTAQIVLLVGASAIGLPWAPSALVNMSVGTNGYSTPKLYLVTHKFGTSGTDDDDGARFEAGHYVVVRDTCPANSNTVTQWGPIQLTAGYNNTSKYISLGSTLTGYSNAKEYVVTAANWVACPSNQRLVGTWQANVLTLKYSDGNVASKWG